MPLIIYSRSNRIKPAVISALKDLNVRAISLGLESGENRLLKYMRKGISSKDNLQACELLGKAGITPIVNFIFGSIGETKQTLESNLKFLYLLKRKNPSIVFQVHMFNNIPGSCAWRLLNKKTNNKYLNQDDPNSFYTDSLNDWFKYFTKVTVEDVRKILEEAKKILIPFRFPV